MPKKKKESNTSKKDSTTEWFRVSRSMNDAVILRKLVLDSSTTNIENQPFDGLLFEKTYGLGAIPKKAVSIDVIEGALGFDQDKIDFQISMSKRKPRGNSLKLQIQSLLPNNVSEAERESLTYVLSRIVTQRIPRKAHWPIIPEGLDSLTAALLHLYIISKAINQRIPWIIAIWKWKIRDAKIDTLESIQEFLSDNSSKEKIVDALADADRKYNEALSLNPVFDNQDPLSQQISGWIAALSVKDRNFQEILTDLKKSVRNIIGEIKGYSSSLKTHANVQSDPVTDWNLIALRADGPSSNEHDSLLRLLRKEFNILGYDLIRKLIINLAHIETPGHPTADDLMQVSEFTGRNAYYEMQRLESLFNEHYILNLSKIGLRYRFIFADRQRSGVASDGLVEKLDFIEEQIRGCTIHIEPNLSKGPDMRLFSGKFVEAVAEHEIVTLNLNHFDSIAKDWLALKQDELPDTKQKDALLIQRSTMTNDKRPFSLTTKQTELLGILWGLEGSRRQRKLLLDSVEYRQQTGTRNLSSMLKNHVMKLLYLPALEFSRLPDGLVAYANCSDLKSRDRLVEHIIESQPFSRIHIGDTNDVIALIRSPFKQSDTVAGNLKEKMQEFSDNYITARIQERKTHKIASFHKLMEPKSGTWRDPWRHS